MFARNYALYVIMCIVIHALLAVVFHDGRYVSEDVKLDWICFVRFIMDIQMFVET